MLSKLSRRQGDRGWVPAGIGLELGLEDCGKEKSGLFSQAEPSEYRCTGNPEGMLEAHGEAAGLVGAYGSVNNWWELGT